MFRITTAFAALVLSVGVLGTAWAGSEIPLTAPSIGPADSRQANPHVATDGTDFLAAWIDSRGIYATRVSAQGEVLDGTGIRIPINPLAWNPSIVAVLWTGETYAIIHTYQMYQRTHTLVARISRFGEWADGPRVILERVPYAAASNGRLVVISTDREIYVTDSEFQDFRRIALSSGAREQLAASNGSTFLVATNSPAEAPNWVDLTPIDAAGEAGVTSRDKAVSRIAFLVSAGEDYLLRLEDSTGSRLLRIAPDGTVKSVVALPNASAIINTSAVFVQERFLLMTGLMRDSFDVVITLNAVDGTLNRPETVLQPGRPGFAQSPKIAWNGSRALVVWTDPTESRVIGVIAGPDAQVKSPPFHLARSSARQHSTVIATGGEYDLVAWIERSEARAVLVDAAGQPRGDSVRIATADGSSVISNLQLLFDGSEYVMFWKTNGGVFSKKIDDATGLPQDPVLSAGAWTSFHVVRTDDGLFLFGERNSMVWVVPLPRSGGLPGDAVAISPSGMLATNPRAAWNGSEWLVVWHELVKVDDYQFYPIYQVSVLARRVSRGLVPLEIEPIGIARRAFSALPVPPQVSTDGVDFVVAWTQTVLVNDSPAGLLARHVPARGSPGKPNLVVPGTFLDAHAMVWDGRRYAIGFAHEEYTLPSDLFLTYAGPDGVGSGVNLAISATPEQDVYLSLVARGPGLIRLAYSRTVIEPEYGGVLRAFIRDIDPPRRRAVVAR